MTDFFDRFWGSSPLPSLEARPAEPAAAPIPAVIAKPRRALVAPRITRTLDVPYLPTPDDEGLSDPVRLVRAVERRMRAEGLLDEDEERPFRRRLHRPANDRWPTPRAARCG